jgi:hypothetical protein
MRDMQEKLKCFFFLVLSVMLDMHMMIKCYFSVKFARDKKSLYKLINVSD